MTETTKIPPDLEVQLKLGVPAAYREALRESNIPMEKIRSFGRVRLKRILLDLGLAAGSLLAVPLLYAASPHALTFFICFILSIRTFNCFAQLVHTSDHGGLFRDSRANRIVGNFCAYFLGYTRTGHRLTHLNHHLYLNTGKDPDQIWGTPEQTMRDLSRMWLRDFFLVSAVERLLQYSQSDRETFSVTPWESLTLSFVIRGVASMYPVILTQGFILSLYTLVLGPAYYFLLYVLPILTFYPAQIRLRSTVEHSFEVGYRPTSPEDVWVTRSTRAGAIERFIFAPFGIHYHFEHHLFPGIPHYNLSKVHRLLVECGFPVPMVPGYVSFVVQKMRTERAALAAGRSS